MRLGDGSWWAGRGGFEEEGAVFGVGRGGLGAGSGFRVRVGRGRLGREREGMGVGGGGNSRNRSRFGDTSGGRRLRRGVHIRHGAGPGRGSGRTLVGTGGRWFRTFGWMFWVRFAAVHEGGGFSGLSLSLLRGTLFLQALATCPGSPHSKHLTDSVDRYTL